MRIDRPVGVLLLLWPTLAALWVAADGLPPIGLIVVFSIGTFLMRAAGCVINDYADRHLDGAVKRTAMRPLAAGTVSERGALGLFAVLALLAFSLLPGNLNAGSVAQWKKIDFRCHWLFKIRLYSHMAFLASHRFCVACKLCLRITLYKSFIIL